MVLEGAITPRSLLMASGVVSQASLAIFRRVVAATTAGFFARLAGAVCRCVVAHVSSFKSPPKKQHENPREAAVFTLTG